METTQFVLGLLTMISITLIIGVVVNLLRINRLAKQVDKLEAQNMENIRDAFHNADVIKKDIWRHFEDIQRDIDMIERTLSQSINHEVNEARRQLQREIEQTHRHIEEEVRAIHQHEDEIENVIHREIDETKRYIDSRIDKTVLSGTMKSSKQRLNG